MSNSSASLIIANWKMNLSIKDSVILAKKILKSYKSLQTKKSLELVLCPTFPALWPVAKSLLKSKIKLGAQDIFWQSTGAYTGEVSPVVLVEAGVSYVLIGHSERRQYLKETDVMIKHKVAAALAVGLVPVVCVGETFAERQAGRKDIIISRQIQQALAGLSLTKDQRVVVAYEPVWVIGSGQAVDNQELIHTAQVIGQTLVDIFSSSKLLSGQVRLVYGGSVDASNIATCLSDWPLSGVLVGGASLQEDRFSQLLKQL
ncbi:triose-phosphate isomerase [Patescibacteria group bacterium]|nr:triose-phosphate isomerase [Patescibacteria group bacterium]